jgi:hypothetical protein
VKSVKLLNPNPAYQTRAAYVNFVHDSGPDLVMKLDGTVPEWNEGVQVHRFIFLL